MKVFLTGGSGYIGSAVAIALKKAGHDVRALVRSESKSKALKDAGVKLVVGDLKDPAGYSAAAWGCAAIVHTAAEMSADMVELDKKTINAARDLLRGQVGATFIYTSGCWVAGQTGEEPVDESSAPNPLKIVAWRPAHEKLALDMAADEIRSVVVRPGVVYGGKGGIPSMFFKGAPTIGDGANKWPMVHVDDLAELYVRLVERAPARSVWNAVDASRLSQREIAEAASKAAGKAGDVSQSKPDGSPFSEALCANQVLSSEKARNELDWRPRHENFAAEAELLFKSWQATQ